MTTTEVSHDIAVSRATERLDDEPLDPDIVNWLVVALGELNVPPKEVSVRIVDSDEMAALNETYRGRAEPTNVLSFPSNLAYEGREMLGDIVICSSIVAQEAASYGKDLHHRYAHMLIHGLLHLMGHDHEESGARDEMETLEGTLMARLDMPDPYSSLKESGSEHA